MKTSIEIESNCRTIAAVFAALDLKPSHVLVNAKDFRALALAVRPDIPELVHQNRLTIGGVVFKKSVGSTRIPWTKKEDMKLTTLILQERTTYRYAAEQLGRTLASCSAAGRRLGLDVQLRLSKGKSTVYHVAPLRDKLLGFIAAQCKSGPIYITPLRAGLEKIVREFDTRCGIELDWCSNNPTSQTLFVRVFLLTHPSQHVLTFDVPLSKRVIYGT